MSKSNAESRHSTRCEIAVKVLARVLSCEERQSVVYGEREPYQRPAAHLKVCIVDSEHQVHDKVQA